MTEHKEHPLGSYEVNISERFDRLDEKLDDIRDAIAQKASQREFEMLEREVDLLQRTGSSVAQNATKLAETSAAKIDELEKALRNLGWKFVITLVAALVTIAWQTLAFVSDHVNRPSTPYIQEIPQGEQRHQ